MRAVTVALWAVDDDPASCVCLPGPARPPLGVKGAKFAKKVFVKDQLGLLRTTLHSARKEHGTGSDEFKVGSGCACLLTGMREVLQLLVFCVLRWEPHFPCHRRA